MGKQQECISPASRYSPDTPQFKCPAPGGYRFANITRYASMSSYYWRGGRDPSPPPQRPMAPSYSPPGYPLPEPKPECYAPPLSPTTSPEPEPEWAKFTIFELRKVVVQTTEDVEPMNKAKATNAIFYISFKHIGGQDYNAIIRRTTIIWPEYMKLDIQCV
ncbi:hypothetical protein AALP_AA8G487800 [Arabis alpina]|uniref:Uncharacterized protein n=1 Tax=Arabis alpina TaxID=50452 RepID=A0A087GEB4_ARAAL|nr:hypothetical protein AALP_AA8G487800 [Arabis alpina]